MPVVELLDDREFEGDDAMNQMTALLVEDREKLREQYARSLRKRNIKVYEADSKSSALRIYRRLASQIAVVLTDWRLIDNDENNNGGMELAESIRSLTPEQVIVCMTAYHQPQEVAPPDLFDMFFEKSPAEKKRSFTTNIPKIIDFVSDREKRKRRAVPESLVQLKKKYRITDDDFHKLIQNRSFTPSMERAILAFHNSNDMEHDPKTDPGDFQVPKMIDPGCSISGSERLKVSLLVVSKEIEGHYVSELYGHPMVYTYGETEQESDELLLELLFEYYEDTCSEDGGIQSKDVVNFSHYLKELFEVVP
ncbi:MAG: response regulator [Magnetococcales bacterium]|nr:response regulator [Magnetococcales bacterium]